MDITPLIQKGRQTIDGYGRGFFRIAGAVWRGPVIVTPEKTMSLELSSGKGSISCELMEEILRFARNAEGFDILLVGTGKTAWPVDPEIRQAFRDCGTALDVMETGAACRTYNVLMPEGRAVAAALIPV